MTETILWIALALIAVIAMMPWAFYWCTKMFVRARLDAAHDFLSDKCKCTEYKEDENDE